MRSSASSRLRNGGYTRTRPGSRRRACRAARPSGPSVRTTTSVGVNRPRRLGCSVVRTVAVPAGGQVDGEPAAGGAQRRRQLVGDVGAHRPSGAVRDPPPQLGLRPEGDDRRHRPLDLDAPGGDGDGASRPAPTTTSTASSSRAPPGRSSGSTSRSAASGEGDDGEAPRSGPASNAARAPRRGCRRGRCRRVAPSSSTSGRSRRRWRSAGLATAFTSSGVTNERPASHAHALAACRRAAAPRGDTPSSTAGAIARRPRQGDDVGEHRRLDGEGVDLEAGGLELGGAGDRPDPGGVEVVGVEAPVVAGEDLDLLLLARVADVELEQEPVELGLGQRVGALLLDRVLGGDDDERLRQRVGVALDRHLALLHRLEQGGLRLRRRAVDLVGEEQVGEHRSLAEAERAAAWPS